TEELQRSQVEREAAESTWRNERSELELLAQQPAPTDHEADKSPAAASPDTKEMESLRRAQSELRAELDQVNARREAEQEAAAESQRRVQELETSLENAQAELEAAR